MSLKLVHRPKSPNWIMRGTVRGQSIEESTGTPDLVLAEVIRASRKLEMLNESAYGKQFTMTFAHATADYLEYGSGAKRFVKPLLNHFSTAALRSIGQDEVDKAAAKLYPKATAATKKRQVFTPMSAILHHAARKGWCTPPHFTRPKQKQKPARWVTQEEARRLVEACPKHLKPLVIVMLNTGARAGELLWIDWSNIDLELKQITFDETKNGETRSVPLNSAAMQALCGFKHRKGTVFLTHKGRPYRPLNPKDDADTSAGSRIGTAFGSACWRAGIENFTPHCCRHTWATWHYRKNRDLATLQKLGGWKTVAMVLRYAHTNVQEHADSMENLS